MKQTGNTSCPCHTNSPSRPRPCTRNVCRPHMKTTRRSAPNAAQSIPAAPSRSTLTSHRRHGNARKLMR
eukprot:328583-Chlamydomonas_euryale.AAC.1